MLSENTNPVKLQRTSAGYRLFDARRTRCGYNNKKVGEGTPTISTMPGTAASLQDNASKTALAIYADVIAANAGKCTTCNCDCPGCYAKALKAYTDVFEKYLLNTIELFTNPRRFYALVEAELFNSSRPAPPVVRLHEAGEFASADDIAAFLEFAARHPETIFFGYSKDARIHSMMLLGVLPANVRFACSPWTLADGTVLCPPIGDAYQFIYDDGTSRARDGLFRCPCSNPDGTVNKSASCIACGRCIACKDGAKTIVYPHKPAGGLANSWLAGRLRLVLAETGADNSLAAYRAAALAAYREALTPAPGAAFWRMHAAAWLDDARATLADRVEKLAKATRAADRKAAKAQAAQAQAAAD